MRKGKTSSRAQTSLSTLNKIVRQLAQKAPKIPCRKSSLSRHAATMQSKHKRFAHRKAAVEKERMKANGQQASDIVIEQTNALLQLLHRSVQKFAPH